nr:hypothetical protein [Tanacetum cinerariifolium]
MQGAFLTQGMVSSIPTTLSWGGSIRPDSFLSFVLLLAITSSSWPFASAIPSQITHLVASITLNSARSCVMQGAFLTQGMVSSIPTTLSWGGSIRPDSFLSFVLLLAVIIVAVVAIVLVVIVATIRVVVVVESSSVVKLSFMITQYLH